MKEKESLKITVPTLLLIVTTLATGAGYFYSLDKRLSIVEQNIVHVEQDGEQRDRTLSRIEDKVDKIPEQLEQLINLFKK